GDFCNDFAAVWPHCGPTWEEVMRRFLRASFTSGLTFIAGFLLAASVTSANAAEKLRVAEVVPFAWSFTPLDIGIETGIFARHGLDIEASASAGDAKLQQLLTSGSDPKSGVEGKRG